MIFFPNFIIFFNFSLNISSKKNYKIKLILKRAKPKFWTAGFTGAAGGTAGFTGAGGTGTAGFTGGTTDLTIKIPGFWIISYDKTLWY